jgi:hypothetical protein
VNNPCVAFGIPEGGQAFFPFKSPEGLGVDKLSFSAIKSLFPFLNRVFRGNGNPLIPQEHSTVGDHTNGLIEMGKKLFFDPAKETNPDDSGLIGDVEKKYNLIIALHDMPELVGEISTYWQRLNGEVDGITEQDRKVIEDQVAEIVFYLALKSAEEGDDRSFLEPLAQTQASFPIKKDQYARYKHVKENFVDRLYGKVKQALRQEPSIAVNHKVLMDAYSLLGGTGDDKSSIDNFAGLLAKVADGLESKYYVGSVSDWTVAEQKPQYKKDLEKGFRKIKDYFDRLAQLTSKMNPQKVFSDITDNVKQFFLSCQELYPNYVERVL